jgi:hypothetical protein
MDRMRATELKFFAAHVSGRSEAAGKPGIKFAYLNSEQICLIESQAE